MQDEESFEDVSGRNRKSGATIWDALIKVADVIKELGIEILKPETDTNLGNANLFISLFVFMIFFVQSFKTTFDTDEYEFMFLFAAFFILSMMMAKISLRSKEVNKLRKKIDELRKKF
jgi:hypothetical protein